MNKKQQLVALLGLTCIVAVLGLGFNGNAFVMRVLVLGLVFATVGSAWDLIMGYAGIFSFAQVAFFAIGAYATAVLSTKYGVSPWLGILLGGMLAAVVGVLVGLPCLRLKGAYVALLTFALHMFVAAFVTSKVGKSLGTGGPPGVLGIPPFSVGGYRFTVFSVMPWFLVALGLFVVSLVAIWFITHSYVGTAFLALRDSEQLAGSLGVNAFGYKMLVFAISAFLTGAMGAFFAHYTGAVAPSILGLDMFLLLMVMQVIGGLGVFPGTAYAAFVVLFVNEYLRAAEQYRPMLFGVGIMLLVVFLPRGILGSVSSPLARLRGPLRRIPRFKASPRQLGAEATEHSEDPA